MQRTHHRQGSNAIEYALIAAVLGAGLVVAITNLGAITGVLFGIVETLSTAAL
ncbi:MAG TPA: Flp family type IVb pilin [Myxococcota bacterium]|nr:Flp family type IVb pilin [Myxococcota bacterium]HND31803.1 Flp family type IVb pilin [Myxococcota bacterium]